MRIRYFVLALLFITLASGLALAYSSGAPASRTGAPAVGGVGAEGTCVSCHSGNALNDGIAVTLVNAPQTYTAGTTYNFSVQVASSNTAGNSGRRWAFELTAVDMADGTGAGNFTAASGTQVVAGNGQYSTREYLQCTTYATGSTPKTWQVQWTAPADGTGAIGFYVSGMAADGNGQKSGDWVGTGSLLIQNTMPVEPSTWGGVKALYR